MDFELNKEQKALQKAAWEFAKKEFTPELALECEENHRFPHELHRKACELGFLGMHYPEEYGGQGYGFLETVLVMEAFCRKDPGLGTAVLDTQFGSSFVTHYGTDEQKKTWLPKVVSGEVIFGAAFTEPNHGSDLSRVETTAVREDDEYVVNGVKTFITNGKIAKVLSVLCRTDQEVSLPHKGLSMLLVETDRPGFEATDVGTKMGWKASSTCEIVFKNVRVPVSNLLGTENRGFYHAMELFTETRIDVAANSLGGAQAAFDRALSYAKQREQFGKRLTEFQAIQHKLAEMATKIELARLITYKAAWTYDNRTPDPQLSSMAKLYASEIASEVADEAIQIMGGYGYLLENEVERIYRDLRINRIFEGTNEIQKSIIASHLTGRKASHG